MYPFDVMLISNISFLLSGKLIRTLHMFYLHRVLRLFPILAAMVLFEASLFNYVSDGPLWIGPAQNVLRCRQYWWSTLLHIQNFVNPINLVSYPFYYKNKRRTGTCVNGIENGPSEEIHLFYEYKQTRQQSTAIKWLMILGIIMS